MHKFKIKFIFDKQFLKIKPISWLYLMTKQVILFEKINRLLNSTTQGSIRRVIILQIDFNSVYPYTPYRNSPALPLTLTVICIHCKVFLYQRYRWWYSVITELYGSKYDIQ